MQNVSLTSTESDGGISPIESQAEVFFKQKDGRKRKFLVPSYLIDDAPSHPKMPQVEKDFCCCPSVTKICHTIILTTGILVGSCIIGGAIFGSACYLK